MLKRPKTGSDIHSFQVIRSSVLGHLFLGVTNSGSSVKTWDFYVEKWIPHFS